MQPERTKWPKIFPELTPEQQRISDDFMKYWHEVLPRKYSAVDQFGHKFVLRSRPDYSCETLEIGAGLGEHIDYEHLSDESLQRYHALDIRPNMIDTLKIRYPMVNAQVADCQKRLPFDDGRFGRILAIHLLEHLPDLPAAVSEINRLCSKPNGVLGVVIPCEGGALYSLARKISAQRIFEKRYKQPYKWFISREHINTPDEILYELQKYFDIVCSQYFPFFIPLINANLVAGFVLRPKNKV